MIHNSGKTTYEIAMKIVFMVGGQYNMRNCIKEL